ncbi:MAG: undecaprenyl-phosphate glucose phosphotransferase [Anaerolineae bacterium]|nr:undecaprenyl-phosphate glucose phosphotransferase [Anaerolineae bacterium]
MVSTPLPGSDGNQPEQPAVPKPTGRISVGRVAARRLWRWAPWVLAATDAILINTAFLVAYWLRYDLQWFRSVDPAFDTPRSTYAPFAFLLTALLLLAYRAEGAYDLKRGMTWFDEVLIIINGTTTAIIVMVVITFFYRSAFYSRLIFIYAAILIVLILSLARAAKGIVLEWLRRRGIGAVRTLIVGASETGRTVMRNLVARPELGYRVVGFVDDDRDRGCTDIGRFKALGPVHNLPALLRAGDIDEVVITLPWQEHREIIRLVAECQAGRVRARIVPDLFQLSLSHVDVEQVSGIPLISLRDITLQGSNLLVKRAFDLTVASVSLVVASPLLLLIALAIRLDSPGPALFRQRRIGRGGRAFTAYKFRSMIAEAEMAQAALQGLNQADGPLFKMKDDPRRTRVGRILRRLSLDELPQLYNVLRGEMSLVGPRPALPQEVAQYQEWHKKRLEVAPGITGLWQVRGRSELSFDEMMLLDIYYAENWSPGLDLRILLETIPKVLTGHGAY